MASILRSDRLGGEWEDLVTHTPLARERCRAQALLWLADGASVEQIAELLQVSRQTISNWTERFRPREGLDLRARLRDAPRSGRPPPARGIIDPWIEAVIDRDPRELGSHSTVWTAALLIPHLKRVHGVEVSRKRSSAALARLGIRWKRPRHELALRPETWRQSKGG